MGLKKFVKPTIWKIILTILLTLVIVYSISSSNRLCPQSIISCSEGDMLYTHPFIPGSCPSCVTANEIVQSFIGLSIVYLIFSYLISCLIVFIYNKIKKLKYDNKRG